MGVTVETVGYADRGCACPCAVGAPGGCAVGGTNEAGRGDPTVTFQSSPL